MLRPFDFLLINAKRHLECHLDSGAGIGVFQHPQSLLAEFRRLSAKPVATVDPIAALRYE
jgi:hypothetical protein